MWAGEMLQSERIKSESYVKTELTAHTLKCPHWQRQINFHMNTGWDFHFFIFLKFILYPWPQVLLIILLLLCASEASAGHCASKLPTVFPQNASSFPNRSHNIDTTDRDWPELHLPSLKSTDSDQNWNPLVFFFRPPLFLLLVRFHFFLLRIWEPVCDQSGFWSSSISNKSERPRRDYVNAWWQQPGCDAGWGGRGVRTAVCVRQCANAGIMLSSSHCQNW